MCGADGTDSPVWTTVSPSVNVAHVNSSPETNCDEADASISTVPPATDPLPCTRNGRPSPSSATPSPRIASSSGEIGLALACSSPSKVTTSAPSAATGGTKRSTVPARPQSMVAPGAGPIAPPTDRSVREPSTVTPRVRRAPIIRSVSRLRSAPLMVDFPCAVASAASTSARLVCDFEPGTVTVACTGLGVVGACQPLLCSSRPRVLTVSILPCRPFLPPWDICVGDSR
jgi:hypothetical protein